jgi:hypothetical protein
MPLTRIQSLGITDGTIVAGDIASGAITAAKLASGVGGKVLQVSSLAITSGLQNIATDSYTDITGLSITITPSSTSSKIILLTNVQSRNPDAGNGWGIRFVRGATNIYTGTVDYTIFAPTGNDRRRSSFVFIDSPNTTSATTYKVQAATYASGTINFNDGDVSTFYLMEIAG